MGMEGKRKEKKRKIALEILDEADKIMEMAKMLADEDDPFARRGLYAFLDAEMKALRTLVIWCSSPNNSPFSLYSDGLFGASSSPRLRAGVLCGKKGGYSQSAGSISIGSMSMSAGLRSAGRSPTRSVAPGAPGHIAGSLRRSSAQRFVHAT